VAALVLGMGVEAPAGVVAAMTGSVGGGGPYLTGPSSASAVAVVRGYLRAHPSISGVDLEAAGQLALTRQYPTRDGNRKLMLQRQVDGLPVLGQEVFGEVTEAGRLVNVFAPATAEGSSVSTAAQVDSTPPVEEGEAVAAAEEAVGARSVIESPPPPTFRGGAAAELVLQPTMSSYDEEWRTLARSAQGETIELMVDAHTGEVLSRRNLTDAAVAADVFEYYPGAPGGGEYVSKDITPYVSHPGGDRLEGNNAYAFSELEANNVRQDVAPTDAAGDYDFDYFAFNLGADGNCPPAPYYCSWNTRERESWAYNQDRAAVQLFYQVNRFHDHLAEDPIDFDAAKGAYEGDNKIWAKANYGADTGTGSAAGLPSGESLNNGFFSPDPGGPPTIRMFLNGSDAYLHGTLFAQAPYAPTVNVADDGAFVFHEYTHGLTEALTSETLGISQQIGAQGVAMAEGWSDWYAMDFVVGQGWEHDTSTPGEIEWSRYTSEGPDTSRPQALDCPVGALPAYCPAVGTAGSGGFTYGDMGRMHGYAEPHDDGTIWSQTLWDLRQRLIAVYGTRLGDEWAELLVTAALELSPPHSSFLDERNAILEADAIYNEGADEELIWSVFAGRGMGYFASTIGAYDAHPIEDFSMPPTGSAVGTVSGTVTTEEGTPVSGATVAIGGFRYSFSAVTDSSGRYSIKGVPVGTYHQLVITSPLPGFDDEVGAELPINPGTTTLRDVSLRRDWASVDAGAAVVAEVGPTYYQGCSPTAALDQNLDSGWATYAPTNPEHPGPKSFTVELPQTVDISSVAIEPSAYGCLYEEGQTAALAGYKIEVSADGTNWSVGAEGIFTGENGGKRNVVAVSASEPIRYVRLVGDSTISSADGDQGEAIMSATELSVYGAAFESPPSGATPESGGSPPATAAPATPAPTPPPATVPPATGSPRPTPHCKKGFRTKRFGKQVRCVKAKKHHKHDRHPHRKKKAAHHAG
jgi:hypothetical protein